jgi:hypothetical protein
MRASELLECCEFRYDLHSVIGGAIGFRMIFDCLRFAIAGEFSVKNGWDKLSLA